MRSKIRCSVADWMTDGVVLMCVKLGQVVCSGSRILSLFLAAQVAKALDHFQRHKGVLAACRFIR